MNSFDTFSVSFTDKRSLMQQRSSRPSRLRPYFRRKFLVYAGVPLALLCAAVAIYRYHPPASITVFMFEDYLTPELKEQFKREYHIRIKEETFHSNQEMMARLKVGWGEYDVVTPSNYVLDDLRRRRLVRRLDPKKIPNLKNLDSLLQQYFPTDYLNYAVPYVWTTLSIAYREGAVSNPPQTWKEFFSGPAGFNIPVAVLREKRETMGVALLSLGYEPATTKASELAELRKLLIAFKDRGVVFSTSPIDELLLGRAAICLDWTSNILRGMQKDPKLRHVIPDGPTLLVLDNLVIPTSSRKPELAEKFINFMLRPDVAAKLGRDSFSLTSVSASFPMVPNSLQEVISESFQAGQLVPLTGFVGSEEKSYDVLWSEFNVHRDD